MSIQWGKTCWLPRSRTFGSTVTEKLENLQKLFGIRSLPSGPHSTGCEICVRFIEFKPGGWNGLDLVGSKASRRRSGCTITDVVIVGSVIILAVEAGPPSKRGVGTT